MKEIEAARHVFLTAAVGLLMAAAAVWFVVKATHSNAPYVLLLLAIPFLGMGLFGAHNALRLHGGFRWDDAGFVVGRYAPARWSELVDAHGAGWPLHNKLVLRLSSGGRRVLDCDDWHRLPEIVDVVLAHSPLPLVLPWTYEESPGAITIDGSGVTLREGGVNLRIAWHEIRVCVLRLRYLNGRGGSNKELRADVVLRDSQIVPIASRHDPILVLRAVKTGLSEFARTHEAPG